MPLPVLRNSVFSFVTAALLLSCASSPPEEDVSAGPGMMPRASRNTNVTPGITVLVRDSIGLLAGKRVGLLTNQTGVNEKGVSDIDLLRQAESDPRAKGMKLTMLFSPEHGIRGTEDRTHILDSKDQATGLPIISLYGENTLPPPDSALDQLDALVIDLQDIGARPWTYVATMVYAVRAAGQHKIPVLVLDRPNPISGDIVEGPVLDSTLAFAGSQSTARWAQPTALYPIPLRHGMTMAELAKFYEQVLELHADLHAIPMYNWRRSRWYDKTGLPWVNPSPNMTSLASATLYPGIVLLEAANVSVGRGTPEPFQWVGAPWMDAKKVIDYLDDRPHPGVKFSTETQTPDNPTDQRYGGKRMKGIKITITNRAYLQTTRLGAWLMWAIKKTHPEEFKVDSSGFSHLFGLADTRARINAGEDPDQIVDGTLPATVEFRRRTRPFLMYP